MSVPSGNFTVNFQGLEELKQRLEKLNKTRSKSGTHMRQIMGPVWLQNDGRHGKYLT